MTDYKLFGIQFNIVNVIICIALGFLICIIMGCSCVKHGKTLKEGMTNYAPVGKSYGCGKKSEPVSSNSDSMFYLKNNVFKPECCPSNYSNANGCACISKSQYDYLNSRGGNRVPNTIF